MRWILGGLRVKQPERVVLHSYPCSIENNNTFNINSISLYAVMLRCLGTVTYAYIFLRYLKLEENPKYIYFPGPKSSSLHLFIAAFLHNYISLSMTYKYSVSCFVFCIPLNKQNSSMPVDMRAPFWMRKYFKRKLVNRKVVACSCDVWVFNKSNYQFKRRL
jgi:hypothetical protein